MTRHEREEYDFPPHPVKRFYPREFISESLLTRFRKAILQYGTGWYSCKFSYHFKPWITVSFMTDMVQVPRHITAIALARLEKEGLLKSPQHVPHGEAVQLTKNYAIMFHNGRWIDFFARGQEKQLPYEAHRQNLSVHGKNNILFKQLQYGKAITAEIHKYGFNGMAWDIDVEFLVRIDIMAKKIRAKSCVCELCGMPDVRRHARSKTSHTQKACTHGYIKIIHET
jgi:hypothetical protein